jgi:AmiR/NasT family two-component response regulator
VRGGLGAADVDAAQALADIATIAILNHRAAIETQTVNAQLSRALNSRVVIEQAKGMVAEQAGLSMEESFSRLRQHARNHNFRLVDVAQSIVDRTVTPRGLDLLPRRPADA